MIMVTKVSKIYRAQLSNGLRIEQETGDFKSLYRAAVRELRNEYGHSLYFEHGSCDISYGVGTTVYEGDRIKTGYIELRDICTITCASMDRKTFVQVRRDV